MSVVQQDERFELMQNGATELWWQAVQKAACATIAMESGTWIYVSDLFEVLALASRDLAFLEVHLVSSATGSSCEFYRTVTTPGLRRLIPLAKVASIAPIVDAETAVPA